MASDGVYFDIDTKLMLHNDSSLFPDDSTAIKTVTNNSSVTLDTIVKKFGNGSAQFSGTNWLSVADDVDFNFGSGDATIEAQINTSIGATYQFIVGQYNSNNGGTDASLSFFVRPTDGFVYSSFSVGGVNKTIIGTSNVGDGSWHHVALVRSSTSIILFVDGTSAELGKSKFNHAVLES